jgi:hypothetical protein
MKKSGTYLLFAYASGFITVLYFIVILAFHVYGAEERMDVIGFTPYWMAVMGLCGIFFSGKYLLEKFAVERSTAKSLIDAVIAGPSLFMACLQLYAAAVFFAGI